MKKIALALLTVLCLSCLCCGVAFAAEADAPASENTAVVKYIKNSFVSGAYLFEENGSLRYGIPLSASEKEYQWEFVSVNGSYQIKNVATGHYITLSGTFGQRTSVIDTDDKDADSLWKLNLSVPSDESQNITSVSSAHNGFALHIIRITDGYVRSEAISSMLSWGEAKWSLYDEKEINFEGVIRDGFCIGDGNAYLDASNFTFRQHSRPDDNYVWRLVLADGGKKLYNLEQNKYLAINGYNLVLTDEASATVFTVFASKGATFVAGDKALALSGSSLRVVDKADAVEFEITLASSVDGVLGDLKLDGVYTFSNSWFNMYMLDDTSVPTYGNSAPDNTQIQWEVKYNEATGYSALYNVGGNEYLILRNNRLTFTKDADYCWKLLRNSNDQYPNAVRFQVASNSNMYLHMESLNGQLQCDTSVQSTWGSPHWEPIKYDPNATATVDNNASVETNKWFRLKSAYGDNLYFYQTNGGYAYGSVAEDDARSHWEFIKDGDSYLMYNRNFDMYLATYGNGYFTKIEDKDQAIRFGVSKYVEDGSYLIYEKIDGQKDYQASYINIKDRDSLMHLSLVSVDIKETHWILEVAPDKIASNDIVINNTVLPSLKEDNRYKLDGKTVYVEHYANYVRVFDKDGKYLTVADNGKTSWKKFTHDYDTNFYFNYNVLGDDMQLSRGNSVITLQQIGADREFILSTGFVVGTDSTLSIYAATAGEYTVKIKASDTGDGVLTNVSVNGILQESFRVGEVDAIDLTLNQGNNLVKFTRMDAIDSVVIRNIVSNGYQGATQGITAYELEDCSTNANIEVDARTRWSMTAEASGRSYVLIKDVAEYVELTLLHDANALTLRYSVPDTEDGSGEQYTLSLYVNGKSTDKLTLTSEYSHLYGTWDYTNNSEDGYHHVYFDETTYVFKEVQPAGTVIRLRKDFNDQADYYALDLLETEIIPDKVEKPDNALSLADYQAPGRSDYEALILCVNAAVAQGKEVYIPAGVYEMGANNSNYKRNDKNASSLKYTNNTLNVNRANVTIRGAGYWYTEIHGLQFELNADNLTVQSLKLMGYANTRNDAGERACFDGGSAHTGLTLANLWIVHYKVGAWLTDKSDTLISGNRIRYTYADGVNFQAGDKTGSVNCVVENNSVRSTGDDGLAAWSEMNADKYLVYRYNTVENPWHANCIVLYGGEDISIYNNILKDPAYRGAGVNISTDFEPVNFGGKITVAYNLMLRCGGDNEDSNHKIGGIWFNMITDFDSYAKMYVTRNVIVGSTYQGISFEQSSVISSLEITENVIVNSGTYGIDFSEDLVGNVYLRNNSISNSALEDILDNHREDMANVVIVNDEVVIKTDNGANIALWCVSGVFIAGACALTVLIVLPYIKKGKGDK